MLNTLSYFFILHIIEREKGSLVRVGVYRRIGECENDTSQHYTSATCL